MRSYSLCTLALLALALPAAPALKTPSEEPFPPPEKGLSLPAPDASVLHISDLLNEFSRVTGQHLTLDQASRDVAAQTPVGLTGPVEVPPEQVYPFVESLLMRHRFAITILRDTEPRLLSVQHMDSRQSVLIRQSARYVPENQLAYYADHPALIIQTSVPVVSIDARQVMASLRGMMVDNTSQHMTIYGEHTLVLLGPAAQVYEMSRLVQEADRLEARIQEAARSEAEEAPPQQGR